MKTMKLKKGGRFMARWPNTQFFYWATIIEPDGEEWKIQFDDGTVTVVKKEDLYDSPPAEALNPVRRVTRSSPTKNRKRPEEIRKSPAKKVRKLFTLEENVSLGTESSGAEESASSSATAAPARRSVSMTRDTANVGKSTTAHSRRAVSLTCDSGNAENTGTAPPARRSVSVTRETGNVGNSASDVSPSPFKRTVTGTKENEDETQSASDVRPSPFKKSDTVTKETEYEIQSASDVCPSPFKTSVTVTKETGDETTSASDVRPSPFIRLITVTKETEDETQSASDVHPSLFRRSVTVTKERENVTQNVTRYTESYVGRDFQSRLTRESSIGSSSLHASPMKGSDSLLKERVKLTDGSAGLLPSSVRESDRLLKERVKLIDDVTSYAESYMDTDFRRRMIREGSIGSAGLRPSPIRGPDSLLGERVKLTDDTTRNKASQLARDYQRLLVRGGSFGTSDVYSSLFRRSDSVTKENKNVTHGGTALNTKFSLEDYERKYLHKYRMEFGGKFGSFLLTMLLPLFIMSVFLFDLVPDPTKFEVLFEKRLLLIPLGAVGVMMLLFLQAVLTIVPIGTVVSGPLTKLGILNIRCNGIFAALFTLILTLSAVYFKREAADIVLSVYNEAAVSAMLSGILFSLILYGRARKLPVSYLNPYGSTGFRWYDFWMGREITPKIGRFNIKLILHRFSVITVIALNVLIVAKAYLQGVEEDVLKSLMMSTTLQSLYCVHFLFHEDIYLYCFLAISEGVGYMINVGYMTYPFILTFTTKAILDYRLKATMTELCIALCAYAIGHLLTESSSYRKTRSVKDPVTSVWMMRVLPKWSHAIQTRTYVGEIIIYWAFAVIAGTKHIGLFVIPAALTCSVLSRAHREYMRCAAYPGGEMSIKQKM